MIYLTNLNDITKSLINSLLSFYVMLRGAQACSANCNSNNIKWFFIINFCYFDF